MRTLILRRAIGEHSILTSAKTEGLGIVRGGTPGYIGRGAMAETWNTRTYSLDLRGFLSLCYPFFVFVVLRTLASDPSERYLFCQMSMCPAIQMSRYSGSSPQMQRFQPTLTIYHHTTNNLVLPHGFPIRKPWDPVVAGNPLPATKERFQTSQDDFFLESP